MFVLLLIVLCSYSGWFVGLIFKGNRMNQLTVKVWQLLRGFVFLLLLVVLFWYSGWFVGLMFKNNRMNRLTVKVWQLLRGFWHNGRLLGAFVKELLYQTSWKFYRRFICRRYVTDGPTTGCGLHVTFCYFNNNLTITQLRDLEQRVVENEDAVYLADNIKMCWLILKTMGSAEATLLYLSSSHCQESWLWKIHAAKIKPIYLIFSNLIRTLFTVSEG